MTTQSDSWVVAPYVSTSFFTLKPASATSSGGKSLLIPTPFAVKMALLDVVIRTGGASRGADLFPAIRDLKIALQPPRSAIVNNTFIKIMRPHKNGPKDVTGTGLMTPMGNTIAFREYVSFDGNMAFAFQGMSAEDLRPLLLQINYFGKRGGFFQLCEMPTERQWTEDDLATSGYTLLTETTDTFNVNGLLQMLDDCGEKMTFEHANIYSGKKITLGKERVLHHVVLPYQLVRSSKSYSYFERVQGL